VAAGLCVSYTQLLAAANSMVAGVEVWVQAQQELCVRTDVPRAALHICCKNEVSTWSDNRQHGCRLMTVPARNNIDAVRAVTASTWMQRSVAVRRYHSRYASPGWQQLLLSMVACGVRCI
jgi:hypothetical protein